MLFHHHKKTYLKTVMALSIAGFIISSYALYLHLSITPSKICNLSATVNCDRVNRSSYAEIAGVPVAAIGMMGYVALFLVAYEHYRLPRRTMKRLLWALTGIATAATLYFIYISKFIIGAWCLVCIGSYVATAFILGALVVMDFLVLAEEGAM